MPSEAVAARLRLVVRRYDIETYKKHKRPKGWGALCPEHVTLQRAQELLDSGVEVEDAIYNIDDAICYRAFCHHEGVDGASLWHGHPIAWARLPIKAKQALVARGRLSSNVYRRAIRKGLGREFES